MGIWGIKKHNISNDFEGVYLRHRMVKEYINAANPELLNHKQVKQAINAITDRYSYRCRGILVNNGFDKDDVYSIVRLFALTFFGHSNVQVVDDKAVRFMSRYINQRLQTLSRWIAKKFGVSEMSRIQGVLSDGDEGLDWFQYVMDWHSAKEYGHSDTQPRRRQQNPDIATLRERLNNNVGEYANQLCYYATVKHVSVTVRRAARTFCKKHGIDYVEWLKRKASETDLDLSQFTF